MLNLLRNSAAKNYVNLTIIVQVENVGDPFLRHILYGDNVYTASQLLALKRDLRRAHHRYCPANLQLYTMQI